MIDGMPMYEGRGKNVALSGGSIYTLPDGILEHILGFVPAPEAVRTCVLARRWRDLWKRATGLRITYITDEFEIEKMDTTVKKIKKFVDHLLRLRVHAPLETCVLKFGVFWDDDEDKELIVNRWFRHVVACRVQVFRLENLCLNNFHVEEEGRPLVSQHLTRLDLVRVRINSELCDFSSCPSLEHLGIDACSWWSDVNISSESLKHLALTDCDFGEGFRVLVYVPSLVSLTLDGHLSSALVLGCMPSLQKAFVRVTHDNDMWNCYYEDCYSCHGTVHDTNTMSVLLEGLSGAENLALISESKSFVFGRDLKQCPTFSKLKNLLLDEHWCVAPVFPALTCILKHSPVLEKLTLQLFSKGPHHEIEIIGICSSMDRSVAVSDHLKAIEIKCEVVDEEVLVVLKFLCSFDISFIFK